MTQHEKASRPKSSSGMDPEVETSEQPAADGRVAVAAIERGGSGVGPDHKASQEPESTKAMPAAGPHGAAHLVNEDATPGAGMLPEPGATNATDATGG